MDAERPPKGDLHLHIMAVHERVKDWHWDR
jgi:hypothetical protein